MVRGAGRGRTGAVAALCVLLSACATASPDGSVGVELAGLDAGASATEGAADEGGLGFDGADEAVEGGELAMDEAGGGLGAEGATEEGAAGGADTPGAVAAGERTGGAGGGSAPRDVPFGRGVSDTEITIGFHVSTGLDQAFAGAGYDNDGSPPDEADVVRALVRWVNSTGGLAGRRVVPVLHATNPTSGTFASQAQAACSTFTEDHEVFAVGGSPVAGTDALATCLAERRTPIIEHNYWPYSERQHRAWAGYFYHPSSLMAERGWTAAIDGLAAADFFDGAKLGVVRYDSPHFTQLYEGAIKPRLARHGVDVDVHQTVSTPDGAAGIGQVAAQLNNVILRFRSEGVTHVLFVEWQGSIPFFFLPQAEAQRYRPEYGLMTFNNPSTVNNQAPEAQAANVLGVGWNAGGDTVMSSYPSNPSAARCWQIMQEAGLVTSYRTQGYYFFAHCDTVFLLREALDRAPELTPAGLQAAVAGLGGGYRSPSAFATRFAPGKADGVAATRLFRYSADCDCFAYFGSDRKVP